MRGERLNPFSGFDTIASRIKSSRCVSSQIQVCVHIAHIPNRLGRKIFPGCLVNGGDSIIVEHSCGVSYCTLSSIAVPWIALLARLSGHNLTRKYVAWNCGHGHHYPANLPFYGHCAGHHRTRPKQGQWAQTISAPSEQSSLHVDWIKQNLW